MIEAREFREIISGRRTDWKAGLARAALNLPTAIYSSAARTNNRLFEWGIRRTHRVSVPVISVGNLTVGGTGKTPLVLWLAQWIAARANRPVILSRGYGAAAGQRNDEALELEIRAPNVPHLQGSDRVRLARQAIADHAAQVLILDDGFQHRRLARDLDIVLIDAVEPFGFGRLLPRGLLREPLASLRRADAIVLTRADLVSPKVAHRIRTSVSSIAPGPIWAEVVFEPTHLIDLNQNEFPINDLRAARVLGFAGIGQPSNFRLSLEKLTDHLVGFRSFPDHHRFTPDDFRSLVQTARQLSADCLVCTCKDLVKIPPGSCDPISLRAIAIATRWTDGRTELERRLSDLRLASPSAV